MESASGPFGNFVQPRIVFEGRGVIVAAKPPGMHCAPAAQPGTLCSWLFGLRPELGLVAGRGRDEGGLLHRLDSATSGLVAFATSDEAFDFMEAEAAAGKFVKSYLAACDTGGGGLMGSKPFLGKPDKIDGEAWSEATRKSKLRELSSMLGGSRISCRFKPYGPGAAKVACTSPEIEPSPGSKRRWTEAVYSTRVVSCGVSGEGLSVGLELTRGFRHQIRAQMAWLGLPLRGDPVYGEGGGVLHLLAWRLAFDAPDGSGFVAVALDQKASCH